MLTEPSVSIRVEKKSTEHRIADIFERNWTTFLTDQWTNYWKFPDIWGWGTTIPCIRTRHLHIHVPAYMNTYVNILISWIHIFITESAWLWNFHLSSGNIYGCITTRKHTTEATIIEISMNYDRKLGAYAMKRVAAGAHLPIPWLFEAAKRTVDNPDYCLELCPVY